MDNSPLAKLSPELRNEIWRLCVTLDESGTPDTVVNEHRSLGIPPAITRTCKQIRDESYLMFYASNTFALRISNGDSLAEFGRREEIFYHSMHTVIAWLQTAKDMPGLMTTSVKLYMSDYDILPISDYDILGWDYQAWLDLRKAVCDTGFHVETKVVVPWQDTWVQDDNYRKDVDELLSLVGLGPAKFVCRQTDSTAWQDINFGLAD